MGYNLTTERIQDTFQQLVQVSGSTLLDGTGSALSVSFPSASYADFAVTASHALNVGSSAWDDITGKPSGLVSSSAQIATDISGAFTSTSASLAAGVATNKANITTNTSDITSLTSATSSYAVKSADNIFSGTQTFQSIAVNGTASIAYLQQVTGSAKVIGDAYIILNADTPSQRYGGLKVYDSGSSPVSTGSFIWDSENNDWFYEYQKDATDYAVALFGPEFATKGTPSYPGTHKVQKGTGGHHLGDSNITDDGTSVTISTPVTASSFRVTTGDISFTPTTIKIGNSVAAGAEEVSLGYNITGGNGYAVNVGTNLTNNGTGGVVLIGRGSTAGGDYSIAIGENVSAAAGEIAIGNGISGGSSNGINIGNMIKYDGSTKVTLDDNVEVSGQLYSPTFAGSVASSTSSIDFDNGNFATLSLTAGTFLADPSNLQSGTTYTIIISSGSLISGHGTAWKFSGGTAPTYTNGTDVLTCVSDGTNLYATALTDFQ